MHQLKERWQKQTLEDWSALAQSHPRLARSVLVGAWIIAALAIVGPLWYLIDIQKDLPDDDGIAKIGEMDQATKIFDDGDRLVFTIFKERRLDVPLSSVSPYVIQAILAIEDQRFYDHRGFDIGRTAAAAFANIRTHRALQGGSTITQQLARQTFLKPDKTVRRKLRELILATRIEARYTKDEILQMYLNKVYFGDGLYGVEAAARGYFGKAASELTVP